MRLNRRALREDDGFTLMELVLTVAILGIVTVSLTGVVILYLKTTGAAQSRLQESTDQQFVSAYWQQDVSSLGIRGYVPMSTTDPIPAQSSIWTSGSAPSGVPAGCTSGLPGTVVVGFAWNDYAVGGSDPDHAWDTTVNAAVYVSRAAGSQVELVRVRCLGSTTKTVTVAHDLISVPTVVCANKAGNSVACTSSSPWPRTVSITLQVEDLSRPDVTGYTTTLTAERRQG